MTVPEPILAVGERLYAGGLAAIRAGYQSRILARHRLLARVISVGNLTWGGTGKTPLVLHLATALQVMGRRVAVLTRGYGRDEAELLARRLRPIPVLVDPDRLRSGLRAVRELGADLLILEDGFQQWRLEKDLEILTVDAASPFGNGHLIPRGVLREPIRSAARADLIVVKAGGQDGPALKEVERQIRRINPAAPLFVMRYRPTEVRRWASEEPVPLRALRGVRICTLAGLAQPAQFEETAAAVGARVDLRYRVGDHHPYTVGEMVRLLVRCRRHGISTVLTTAKDAVRIPASLQEALGPDLKGMELLVLEVEPTFEPDEGEFHHRISSLLDR